MVILLVLVLCSFSLYLFNQLYQESRSLEYFKTLLPPDVLDCGSEIREAFEMDEDESEEAKENSRKREEREKEEKKNKKDSKKL